MAFVVISSAADPEFVKRVPWDLEEQSPLVGFRVWGRNSGG